MFVKTRVFFILLVILCLNFSFSQISNDWSPPSNAEKELPTFTIGLYGFYPKKNCIAYLQGHIPSHSSSGFPIEYFIVEDAIDYSSFKVIDPNLGLAKDKNFYYLKGEKIKVNLSEKLGIFESKRIESLLNYKMVGPFYEKNDSLYSLKNHYFLKYEFLNPLTIQENEIDIDNLSFIVDNLYQDKNNVYLRYYDFSKKGFTLRSLIKNEQIEQIVTYPSESEWEEEEEYLLIGKNSIYQEEFGNSHLNKSSNYKKRSFELLKGKYYLYNKELYHINHPSTILDFESTYGYNIGGLNSYEDDSKFKVKYAIDKTKLRILSTNLAIYDTLLFTENYPVEVSKSVDLSTITSINYFSQNESTTYPRSILSFEYENGYCNDDILRDKNKFYGIESGDFSGYRLSPIKKIHQTWESYNHNTKIEIDIDLNFDLKSFKILNEHYHLDKNGVYYRGSVEEGLYKYGMIDERRNMSMLKYTSSSGKEKKKDVFKNQALLGLNTNKAKTLGIYAYNECTLYFGHIKVPEKTSHNLNLKHLRQIEDSFYFTDGTHLLFQDKIIGKFNKKSLKVHNKYYLEDDEQLIYNGFCKLKIELGLDS